MHVRLARKKAQSEGADQRGEQCGRDGCESPLQASAGADADAQAQVLQGGKAGVGARWGQMGAVPKRRRLHFQTRWVRDGFSE